MLVLVKIPKLKSQPKVEGFVSPWSVSLRDILIRAGKVTGPPSQNESYVYDAKHCYIIDHQI
jgi:hypothetical protein